MEFERRMAAADLRLYAILDAESCARRDFDLFAVARAWRDAGVALVQYRDKVAGPAAVMENARRLREIFGVGAGTFLLLNDYVDLVEDCGFDGAHVGQGDLAARAARAVLGAERILGVSTHSASEALAASGTDVDYVAVGPVFATQTKADAAPMVGLCGVGAARAVVRKPLVAIGGIGPERADEVLGAGADAVAMVSAMLPTERNGAAFTKRARDILAGLK